MDGSAHAQDAHSTNHRNPVLVWLLTIVTFGAYGVYWHWQVNEALRRAGQPVRPALSALAVSWGIFLVFPALISCARTAERVRAVGGEPSAVGTLVSLLTFTYPGYMQMHLNRITVPG